MAANLQDRKRGKGETGLRSLSEIGGQNSALTFRQLLESETCKSLCDGFAV